MKKQLKWVLILAAAFVLLLVLYLTVIRPLTKDDGAAKTDPVPLLEGESYLYFNGSYSDQIPILFPQFDRKDVFQVRVKNGTNDYLFYHYISDASESAYNYFALGQYEGDSLNLYTPPISAGYTDFDYTTLYDDTSKIPTMLVSTGSVFFKERVYVRADAETPVTDAEYQAILHKYGLAAEDSPAYFDITGYAEDRNGNYLYAESGTGAIVCVRENADGTLTYFYAAGVTYTEENGYNYDSATEYTGVLSAISPQADTNSTVRVYVGMLAPDDTCYYLYVEGRDIVYLTGTSSVGDVVNQSLSYYVAPRLMTAADSQYTPYMPVNFRIWNKINRTDGAPIGAGDAVGYSCGKIMTDGNASASSGGTVTLFAGDVDTRMRAALLSAGINVGSVLTVTTLTELPLSAPVTTTTTVDYDFYGVTAIVKSTSLESTAGTVVSAGDIVIVDYRTGDDLTVYSGAIDLGSANTPAAIKSALVGATVGTGNLLIPFASCSVTYDESVTNRFACDYKITSIDGIATDETLSDLKTTEGTAVTTLGYAVVSYAVSIGGVRYTETATVKMSGDDNAMREVIRKAILGKTVGEQTDFHVTIEFPYDPILSYTVYEDLKVESVSSMAEELSFSFVNETKRNSFYGMSLYKVNSPADRSVYALDSDACQAVLTQFSDLSGTETVKVGLDGDAITEFGLDAHVLYFELPFGLYEDTEDGDDVAVDYGYTYSVGYYLYISDAGEDGTRYVGSTMYDIVVKIDAAIFDFMDWDFEREWVWSNLLMLSVADMSELSFTLNFSDLKDSHTFAVTTNPTYYPYSSTDETTARQYVSYIHGPTVSYRYDQVDASLVGTDNRTYRDGQFYTKAGVLVSPLTGGKYLVTSVTNGVNLDERYESLNGEIGRTGTDFDGVANFKTLLSILYLTHYSGVAAENLTEAEKAALTSDADARVLSIRLKMTDSRIFKIDFYQYSSGRCLVQFTDQSSGVVSGIFYLNAGEVKNIVSALLTVVNGGTVDSSASYQKDTE